MIKAGLIVLPGGGWQGGTNYFHNLLSCYQKNPDAAVKLVVFTSDREQFARYQCDAIEVCLWPDGPKKSIGSIPRRAIRRLFGIDAAYVGALKRRRVDLLSHPWMQELEALGRRANIPALLWMPDFQHKSLPQFFSKQEYDARDEFVGQSQRWGHLLLSSRASEADFRRFYPDLTAVQTHILHFSCASAVDVTPLSREELEAQYPIRDPYFFLPNQFWQHKNHGVVIEALRQTPAEIRVVCTGSMDDYRSPGYVQRLLEKVRDAGLESRFVCLGIVPYPALVSLMHYSIAVVQPSYFEGWSTTVEESKAMCKRIVLSNIVVHREQAPERGKYFSPDSAEELAECLKHVHSEFDPATEAGFAGQRQRYKARYGTKWVAEYARILKLVCGAKI